MVDAAQLEDTVQDIRALLATALPYLQPPLPQVASPACAEWGAAEHQPHMAHTARGMDGLDSTRRCAQ
eukprot:scaffold12611_cov22-Tisochrysis_lutea.AAC.1